MTVNNVINKSGLAGQITSVQVEAYISKSVFIKCKFPEEFKENKKFIQKDSSQKIPVEQNQWIPHDKVHMFDDTSAGVLKVFISDLTAADEATYRCGVNTADDHLFTEIKLKISQGIFIIIISRCVGTYCYC